MPRLPKVLRRILSSWVTSAVLVVIGFTLLVCSYFYPSILGSPFSIQLIAYTVYALSILLSTHDLLFALIKKTRNRLGNPISSRKKRAILSLFLIIMYTTPTFWAAVVWFNLPVELVNPSPKKESYSVAIPLVVTNKYFQDILLGLNFTYTTAIVVDEPIWIQGTAELTTPIAQTFKFLFIYFQDGLNYPPMANRNVPFIGQLTLRPSTNPFLARLLLEGNATFYWNHAGTFSPYIWGDTKDNQSYNFGLINYETIQVLPKQTLTEIQTNRTNLVLTYAIFILTALGLAGTIIDLWMIEPSKTR
jgi:hypothetical protein